MAGHFYHFIEYTRSKFCFGALRATHIQTTTAPGVQGSELGSGPRLSNAPVAPLIKELGALARPQQAAVYIVRTDTLLPQLISSLPASPIQ